MKSKILQKGVAIYLSLMIMSVLLAIGLGLTVIIISQIKLMNNIGDSVVALYVADSGIEHSLYNKRIEGGLGVVSGDLGGPSYAYNVVYDPCTAEEAEAGGCIEGEGDWTSTGTFKGNKRSIEIGTISIAPLSLRNYTQNCTGNCPELPTGVCASNDDPSVVCPSPIDVDEGNCTVGLDCSERVIGIPADPCVCETYGEKVAYEDGFGYYWTYTCFVFWSPLSAGCVYSCPENFIWDNLSRTCILP